MRRNYCRFLFCSIVLLNIKSKKKKKIIRQERQTILWQNSACMFTRSAHMVCKMSTMTTVSYYKPSMYNFHLFTVCTHTDQLYEKPKELVTIYMHGGKSSSHSSTVTKCSWSSLDPVHQWLRSSRTGPVMELGM